MRSLVDSQLAFSKAFKCLRKQGEIAVNSDGFVKKVGRESYVDFRSTMCKSSNYYFSYFQRISILPSHIPLCIPRPHTPMRRGANDRLSRCSASKSQTPQHLLDPPAVAHNWRCDCGNCVGVQVGQSQANVPSKYPLWIYTKILIRPWLYLGME